MRKYKILMFTICVMISISESFAQTFAIKAGVNFPKMLLKDDLRTYSEGFKITPRFQLGVTAEFPITKLFSFESGLSFSSIGFKREMPNYDIMQNGEYFDFYQNQTLNYIEIPLTAKANSYFGKLPIYGTFGPYVGIGINGKIVTNELSGITVTRTEYNVNMGSNGNIKRMDYGLQAGAGIKINQFLFGLNYTYGLTNVSRSSYLISKNRVLSLMLGYVFNKKKNNLDSPRLQ